MSTAGGLVGVLRALRARFSRRTRSGPEAQDSASLIRELSRALGRRYVIERKLGEGGMASVFLARERHPARRVVIKVLDPLLTRRVGGARFLREVAIASNLAHPYIVPIFAAGKIGGLLYYVMPYFEGESLRIRLDQAGRLPVAQAIQIALDVADALDYAHRSNVVHRDIKPDNILLADHRALVNDFGIARAVCAACENEAALSGFLVGTPGYMSPEQMGAGPAADHRSDVYSLGCVLHEMLYGTPPPFDYARRRAAAEERRRLSAGHSQRDTVLDPLESALRRALAIDPDERFATMADFAEHLRTGRTRVGPTSAFRAPVNGQEAVEPWPIAVLPFTNLSQEAAAEFFGDGIAADVMTRLSKLGGFRLPSKTSVMRYRNPDQSLREIGAELGVTRVLEGSVRRIGNRVRISAQLVDVPSDQPLWAETYDRALTNVLDAQSEVAGRIAVAVRAVFQGEPAAADLEPTLDEAVLGTPGRAGAARPVMVSRG